MHPRGPPKRSLRTGSRAHTRWGGKWQPGTALCGAVAHALRGPGQPPGAGTWQRCPLRFRHPGKDVPAATLGQMIPMYSACNKQGKYFHMRTHEVGKVGLQFILVLLFVGPCMITCVIRLSPTDNCSPTLPALCVGTGTCESTGSRVSAVCCLMLSRHQPCGCGLCGGQEPPEGAWAGRWPEEPGRCLHTWQRRSLHSPGCPQR